MNPTQEQIKEFWEWCGFKFFRPIEDGAIDVMDPDGDMYLSPSRMAYPKMDPNNLFKWAVPKLQEMGYEVEITFMPGDEGKAMVIIRDWNNAIPAPLPSAVSKPSRSFISGIKKLEIALFETIYKITKEDKDEPPD